MDKPLQQALRTLRGIQTRYEVGSDAGSGYRRPYTLQIALGHGDMLWVAAAIEALEKAASTGVSAASEVNAAT
jgi:hypothetical protein